MLRQPEDRCEAHSSQPPMSSIPQLSAEQGNLGNLRKMLAILLPNANPTPLSTQVMGLTLVNTPLPLG